MNHIPKLDARLTAVSELIPHGAVLLDIGTDHGYLPVNLLCHGEISFAGAADINRSPLSKAVNTAKTAGVFERMKFYLSDGMSAIDDERRYECISVCGMGGELIYDIIDRSDHVKADMPTLVLQPMSSIEDLSEKLACGGYAIEDERIARSSGKLYRIMRVRYSGEKQELTKVEHILGRVNIARGGSEFEAYLADATERYKKIAAGRRAGGLEFETYEKTALELSEIRRRLEIKTK